MEDLEDLTKKVFIYGLVDPRSDLIRYVGKSGNIKRRLKAHKNEKGERRKNRWVRLLKSIGLEPEIKVLEQADENTWQERERWWIKDFREKGYDLLNHTDGGEGLTGASIETSQKISNVVKKRMNDPEFREKIFTPERSLKISIALTGLKKSAEHVAKLPQNQKGRKLTEEHKEKIRKNARGHRWTKEDVPDNHGNKFGLGNKSRTGQKLSPETKEKIAKFQRGKPKSISQRKKMSDARKIWWENRKKNVV